MTTTGLRRTVDFLRHGSSTLRFSQQGSATGTSTPSGNSPPILPAKLRNTPAIIRRGLRRKAVQAQAIVAPPRGWN